MYVQVSIPKLSDGAGSAVAKDPNVLVMFVDDIATEPTRSHGNVAMNGNYTLASGKKAIALYLTPGTISAGYDTEGEVDAKGFKHKLEGEHPGDDASVENFVEAAANKGMVVLVKSCDGGSGKVKAYGSKCNPLFLTPEVTDSKEGNKTKLAFAQEVAQKFLPGVYTGTLPEAAAAAADDSSSTETI
ncbi:MAG: hypothetical protein IJS66_00790 [Bacteroidales bacterium]|nr:hypothetical protein [Bacteroidales bacterium]